MKKISASIKISNEEYELIKNYIQKRKADPISLEIKEENIYIVALRRGMESVLEDLRKPKKREEVEDGAADKRDRREDIQTAGII